MKDFFMKYKNTIIGGTVAFIFASLVFIFGFFKSLFFLIIVGVGLAIGNAKDKNKNVKDYFEDVWSNKGWK